MPDKPKADKLESKPFQPTAMPVVRYQAPFKAPTGLTSASASKAQKPNKVDLSNVALNLAH